MRNLKKVLTLVLCLAMMMSIMVVGAGAAFSDQSKIVNDEAVDMCVALNIISGYPDGSYKPEGNVTRAQMSKMICIALNGGKEPATATKATPTFSDIDGNWAEGYIEYCYAKGIVAGVGGGKFNPDGNVTASQAAKMLLVALGYNADVEKYVGASWELYVNVQANQDGLYKDLENIDTAAALSRDNAAQMIWNALNAETINKTSSIDRTDGSIIDSYNKSGKDMLEVKYDAKEWVGTISRYNDDQEAVFAPVAGGDPVPNFEAYTKDDSDLIGKTIKVLYKDNTTGKDTIYGLFLDDDNTYIDTIEGNIEKVDNDTIKIDGVKYDYAQNYQLPWVEVNSARPVTVTLDKYGDVIAIDSEANFAVGKVAFVGSKSVQVAGQTYNDLDKVEMYTGMAKNDWVVITKNDYTNKTVFTKVDIISGKVSVVNGSDYTIDGTVYTLATGVSGTALALGNSVEIVAVNGYIYNAEKVSGIASLDEVVYISGVKIDTDYGKQTLMAKATFADGSAKEIKVVDIKGEKAAAIIAKNPAAGAYNGLYAFDLDDDEYTLTAITYGDSDKDFEAGVVNGTQAGKDKIAGMRVNDDAVVFVVDKDGDVSVKTGAAVAAWANTTVADVDAYANKTSGVAYVELAAIVMSAGQDTPDASSDAVYGYVTKVLGQTKEDNTSYNSYEIWTADGTQTIKVKAANDSAKGSNDLAAKGAFVKYENDKLILAVGAPTAIQGIAGDNLYVALDSKEYVITDDTQIIYIDVEEVAGAEGALQVADDLDGDKVDEQNIYFGAKTTANSDGAYEVLFIFADVNNDINDVIS